MGEHSDLAMVYDRIARSIPYDACADYIERVVSGRGGRISRVLDLACGTGNTLLPWAKRGCRTAGLDISREMLAAAQAKLEAAGLLAEFIHGDMSAVALPQEYDLVTCLDSINYLPGGGALAGTVKAAYDALVPGGFFAFDLKSAYQLLNTPEDTVVIDEEDLTLCRENRYLPDEGILQVTLTAFVREGELYRKLRETHGERAFAAEGVGELLRLTGFEVVGIYHAFTEEPPRDDSMRIFLFGRRPGPAQARTNCGTAQGN